MALIITVQDREWVAVGLAPDSGDLVWVPTDTEIIIAPIISDDEQPADEPTADEEAPADGGE